MANMMACRVGFTWNEMKANSMSWELLPEKIKREFIAKLLNWCEDQWCGKMPPCSSFFFFTKWWLFIDVQTYKILSTICFMTESERAWVYSWLTWQTALHCIKSFKTSMQNSLLLFLSSNMAVMKLGVNLRFQWGIVLKGYHSLE